MAFAAMLVGSTTAFNAGSPLAPGGATRPALISRAGTVIAHDTAPLEQTSEIMDARLDPQVAQGPFGKGGSLEWLAKLTDAWAELAQPRLQRRPTRHPHATRLSCGPRRASSPQSAVSAA